MRAVLQKYDRWWMRFLIAFMIMVFVTGLKYLFQDRTDVEVHSPLTSASMVITAPFVYLVYTAIMGTMMAASGHVIPGLIGFAFLSSVIIQVWGIYKYTRRGGRAALAAVVIPFIVVLGFIPAYINGAGQDRFYNTQSVTYDQFDEESEMSQ